MFVACGIWCLADVSSVSPSSEQTDDHSSPIFKFDDHSSPIFKSLGITKFLDIRLIQLGQFMYCYLNSLLPNKFNHIFPTHSQQHSYNTRYAAAFCLPQCRTNIKQFSVLYQGPNLYNSLDAKITSSSSLSSFKKKLKGSII